jgi:hypothetical protein
MSERFPMLVRSGVRRAVSLLSVLLCACAASHATDDGGAAYDAAVDRDANTAAEVAAYDEVFDAVCTRATRCSRPTWSYGLTFPALPYGCSETIRSPAVRAIMRGEAHVDPDAARACIEGLATLSCEARGRFDYWSYTARQPREAWPLDDVIHACAVALVHDRVRCGDTDCEVYDRCVRRPGCLEQCAYDPAPDNHCDFPSDCARRGSGRHDCVRGSCRTSPPVGSACNPDEGEDACELGAFCPPSGTCVPLGEVGAPCNPSALYLRTGCRRDLECDAASATCVHWEGWPSCVDLCDPGEYCANTRCTTDATGGLCSTFPIVADTQTFLAVGWIDSCPEGFICDQPTGDFLGGHCVVPRGIGDACGPLAPCIDGATCEREVCVQIDRPHACASGADCPSSSLCTNGVCVPSESCSTDSDCTGVFCIGGVCTTGGSLRDGAECRWGRGECAESEGFFCVEGTTTNGYCCPP